MKTFEIRRAKEPLLNELPPKNGGELYGRAQFPDDLSNQECIERLKVRWDSMRFDFFRIVDGGCQ